MTTLEKLKEVKNLSELARLLDSEPKIVSYILYKIDSSKKYETFLVDKKSGGKRIINAPKRPLLLLQKKLTKILYACVEEHKKERKKDKLPFWPASHGFQKKRTIVTNAHVHRRRRFVFNLDLEDFFGTINFGRVRGFFMNDKMFELNKDVATVIAQIACHENKLPQGSPCSPIISNLIGNILDSRLLALARDMQCTYTRYADDLTFSINKGLFPPDIAVEVPGGQWVVGKKLHKTIKETGFTINAGKTRMSLKQSRQTVTGLVVNKKVNIKREYYLSVRAMCYSLFNYGYYHKPYDKNEKIVTLDSLEGTLSHIYFVKGRRDRNHRINKSLAEVGEFHIPRGTKKLYKKFLFYKYFVVPSDPLIITEGSTDIAYLKRAINMLSKNFPSLASKQNGEAGLGVRFLKSSNTIHDVMYLVNGVAGQTSLIKSYEEDLKKYKRLSKIEHPVIILCDNDKGVKSLLMAASKVASKTASTVAGKKIKITIKTDSTEGFYKLFENLYLVKTPDIKNQGKVIEDLFSKKLLNTKLDGKSFNYKTAVNKNTHYDKNDFAQKVVLKATDPKDFDEFKELLERIQGAITDYTNNP